MRLLLIILIQISVFSGLRAQFEGNKTPTYPELVSYYQELKAKHQVELFNMGESDYGLPIYLCVLPGRGVLDGVRDSASMFNEIKSRTVILINNGIHPGEPDGINACGMLTQDYISGKLEFPPQVTVAFILCYNVGGAMNRGSYSRANQVGPEEYGFRGNAQNLDLNRDFIKMDSRNAFTFARIFQALDPDVFIDTHVSNGADYQHVLTMIYPLKQRQAPAMQELTYKLFVPEMNKRMHQQGIEVVPYVETVKETPDSGIEAFNDLPRYASGYAGLFHSLALTSETHMLKPFEQRVEATYAYLKTCVAWTTEHRKAIEAARMSARRWDQEQQQYRYQYVRTDRADSIMFKGFEAAYKKSEVSGLDRLYYDRTKPWSRKIPYFMTYQAGDSVRIPAHYVVGGQCRDVIERLKTNQVAMRMVLRDSLIVAKVLRVETFNNGTKPYEGHYLHREIKVREETDTVHLKPGDYLIQTNQERRRFICSVLEPEAEDGYFAWNFFDSYVQEKEYFSAYVFEDIAAELLRNDPNLKKQLDEKKAQDPEFAKNGWDQLYFVYQRSPYFEAGFMRLPVYKIY